MNYKIGFFIMCFLLSSVILGIGFLKYDNIDYYILKYVGIDNYDYDYAYLDSKYYEHLDILPLAYEKNVHDLDSFDV